MTRGEGADKSITGNEPLAPGDGDGRLGRAGEGAGSSSHFAVIISADGSATIDGVPVPVVGDESVDIAILDTLHGYARSRNTAVKAAISDPSEEYVAIVEVAPDGSSKLLERRQEGEPEAARSAGLLWLGAAGSGGTETDAIPQPAGRQVTPALSPAPATGESSRKKARPQSDDEHEAPGLLQRPLVIGAVGVAVAAITFGSVWALGSGGAGGGDKQEQAANAGNGMDRSPMDLRPAPSYSPPINPSPSPSVSRSPSASASKSASASASSPPAPKPPAPSKSEGNSDMPKGGVLFVNKKYGFCLDLPGSGRVTGNPQAHDGFCTPSTDNQEWLIHPASRGSGTRGADLYLIRNIKSGRCLEPVGQGAARVTAPVDIAVCNASIKDDNMLWWFDKRPNGTYWVRNQKSSDLCLDVARTDQKAKYANATLFGCDAADDHEWSFRKG